MYVNFLLLWFGLGKNDYPTLWTYDWFVGDVTCKATIPDEMEAEAHFLAKEDGIVAGIALAEMIFDEVDSSLKVIELVILDF